MSGDLSAPSPALAFAGAPLTVPHAPSQSTIGGHSRAGGAEPSAPAPMGPRLRASLLVASALVAGRARPLAAATRRVALRAARRRQTGGGGVAVLERTPDAAEGASKAAKRPPQSEAGMAAGGGSNNKQEPEEVKVDPRQLGATMMLGEGGKEVVFAGGLIGGQSVFGSRPYNFDPLGLSENLPFMLPWFREAELKHGRVAMLGFLGLIGPEFISIPGFQDIAPKCSTAGVGGELRIVEAHDLCVVDQMPVLQISPMMPILLAAGVIEIVTTIQKMDASWGGLTIENAGDYPMRKEIGGTLNQLPAKNTEMVVRKLQELKHCRLAMIGFSGALVQGVLTANGFPWVW